MLWTAVRGASATGSAVLWVPAGLAVAVMISLLLGHAVALTALALIVSGTGTPMRTPGVPGASWRSMLGLGVAAFAGAVVLFNAGGIGTRAGRSAPPRPLTVVSSGVKVRLIAIDGFEPSVFDALSAAGRLPALTPALETVGARLSLDEDAADAGQPDPARLWTTIATAQPAGVHGVRSLETRRVAGLGGILHAGDHSTAGRLLGVSTDLLRLTRPSLASGTERREKTFWEVAGGRGSPNGGGQLVGNLAGGLDQWCGAERSRHAAPRARRPARRGDRARVAVPRRFRRGGPNCAPAPQHWRRRRWIGSG